MRDLIIEPKEKTPGIDLSYGILLFHGRSIMSDPDSFFEPVFPWVKEYIKSPADITAVTLKLEYIDSQSAQILLQIVELLGEIQKKGFVLMVNWYYAYGDIEMLELGELMQRRLEIDFEFSEFEADIR